MRATHIINWVHTLCESGDGLVGIDLEFLVRRDVRTPFYKLVRQSGWELTTDESVEPTLNSLEPQFYSPYELFSKGPKKATELFSELAPILAWLKHTDQVVYDPKNKAVAGHLGHQDLRAVSRKSLKKFGYTRILKLPRGRSPHNLSAGCHLHYDLRTWFESAEHVENFIRLFYSAENKIKGQVVRGRYQSEYGDRFTPGGSYASFNMVAKHTPADVPPDADEESPVTRSARILGQEKNQALNVSKAFKRGDIEVRVFHSTLNVATIQYWHALIVDMIEKSKQSITDWGRYSDTMDPAVKSQYRDRAYIYGRSQFQGRNQMNSREPTRAVRKILGLPKPSAQSDDHDERQSPFSY
jgi:hypothetical protein